MEDLKNENGHLNDGSEKVFNQDEVNKIVQSRLSKAQTKWEEDFESKLQERLNEKESEFRQRDLKLRAKEKNIPEEYLDLIDYSDDDKFNNSVNKIEKLVSGSLETKNLKVIPNKLSEGTPSFSDPFLEGLKRK